MVKNFVTDFILVSESEIRDAITTAWNAYHERIEGSAAAALAALLSGHVKDRPAVAVLTGGNIPSEDHNQIVKDNKKMSATT
jgi:threonine dehydratase